MNPAVLDPLAARYATWLNLPAEATTSMLDPASRSSGNTDEEDPLEVRAMPVILLIERANPPSRTALLEAAAASAIAVCLDGREEWREPLARWLDGHIRKVTRRARGAHWDAVQSLPGITITVNGASARALVPTRVVDTPKEVTRLQISGSELEPDDPGPAPPGVPILWLNPTIDMSAGKAAAQVGHATMLLAALLHANSQDDVLEEWSADHFRCAVRTPGAPRWASLSASPEAIAVRDAGFTEVAPGTITVLAQYPFA